MREYMRKKRAEKGLPPVEPKVSKTKIEPKVKKVPVSAGSKREMTIEEELRWLKKKTK